MRKMLSPKQTYVGGKNFLKNPASHIHRAVAMLKNRFVTPTNFLKLTSFSVWLLCSIAVFSIAVSNSAHGQAPANAPSDRMKTIMFKYTDCVTDWAGEYVSSGASPSEIADGAHSKCQREFQDYVESSEQYFLSITPDGALKTTAIEKARSVASDVRTMTRAHIIRLVIETRAGK